MERIIITFIFSLFLLIGNLFSGEVLAQTTTNTTPPAIPTVNQTECIKYFILPYDKLFFLTEAGICRCNYKIEEIQTDGGYIVFSAGQYKFLATVSYFSKNSAVIKISPCNNDYTFPVVIVKNIFKYIELNQFKKF